MDLQDFRPAFEVRAIDHHLPVKASRSQQGRIEYIRAIGRGDQDDSFGCVEAIHFHKQLIERLFPFIMSTTEACAP